MRQSTGLQHLQASVPLDRIRGEGRAALPIQTIRGKTLTAAHDGGVLPYDRGHEFVFFDAQHTEDYLYQISFIPEPETYTMLLVGLGLVGFIARQRKNHILSL